MICFYHSKDLDGHCSGAIVKKKYPAAEMIGIDYPDPFPADKLNGEDVIMCDFSLQPFSRMIHAAAQAKSFTWIDHHSSAIKDWEAVKKAYDSVNIDKIKAVVDVKFAGCELTWKHLFPDEKMPIAVQLLGRYDVWDKSDKRTDSFQLGVKAKNTDPADENNAWDFLFNLEDGVTEFDRLVEEGKVIKDYSDKMNAEAAEDMAFEVKFEGIKFIAANKAGGSHTFDTVFDPNKHDAMLAFIYLKSQQWKVSMYTTKQGIDLSIIAKKYGGGGHKTACGFESKELPFLEFY